MTKDKDTKSKGEYTFMRQVIKEPPRRTGKILKKIAAILASGVAIGVVAAVTFAHVLPYFQEDEPDSKIEFPDDDYTDEHLGDGNGDSNQDSDGNSVDNPGENNPDGLEVQPTNCPEKLTLDGFRQVYEEIVDVAEQSEKAMVLVQGITSEVDWMNNSYENKTQVSGVLVAENVINYYVLTEYRAAKNVERILVTLSNGSTVLAEFVKHDPGTGLAVLKIAKSDVEPSTQSKIAVATLGSSWAIRRGETVIAIGSPTGYSGSIAYGMVTSTNNVKPALDTQYHLLITDILGDSEGSGVLISLDGEVIGVMLQSFSMEKSQNVLAAIPISEVKRVIEKLVNDEDLVYLGIVGQDITEDLAKNTEIPRGIYVNSVEEDSPAMQVGIQNGDVIVGIGDTNIRTLQELKTALDFYAKGSKISVSVMRRSVSDHYVQIIFDVTLGTL